MASGAPEVMFRVQELPLTSNGIARCNIRRQVVLAAEVGEVVRLHRAAPAVLLVWVEQASQAALVEPGLEFAQVPI